MYEVHLPLGQKLVFYSNRILSPYSQVEKEVSWMEDAI